MFVLPTNAGGGACAPFQSRYVVPCTSANGCYSFYRTTNATFWNQAMGANLGFATAAADLNLDGGADAVGDLSDPTLPSSLPWKRLNAVHRVISGWCV